LTAEEVMLRDVREKNDSGYFPMYVSLK